jgi:hypothetical protein
MIYIVWAKSCSPRDTLVGYATGEKDDIAAFFADRAEYGIYLQELNIVAVGAGYAAKRDRIIEQAVHLRETADKLEKELSNPAT